MAGYGFLLQSGDDGHAVIMEVPCYEAWGSLLSVEEREVIRRKNEKESTRARLAQEHADVFGDPNG